MKTIVKEGEASIEVHTGKISKELPVFYNPIMSFNRDITVSLLNSVPDKELRIADPLAGSGVRSVRMLKELRKGKVKEIALNDGDEKAVASIKKNFSLNKISLKKVHLENTEANAFLLKSGGFDYIDVDPFGSPNSFLDASIKRLARCGILGITATDTAALCGTYPKAGKRKYWAIPKKGPIMHEIGLRILIRKVQLVGAQYDRALTPLLSYSKDHYFRVFFRSKKGKKEADAILKQHGMIEDAGPLWLGQLWDQKVVNIMLANSKKRASFQNKENAKFLQIIKEESEIGSVGFHDLHHLCKKNKISPIPKKEEVIAKLKKKGFKASNTHFKGEGMRSDVSEKELCKILSNL